MSGIFKLFFKRLKSADESGKKNYSSEIERNVNPSDIWEIISELGDGAFGKVYKTHKRGTDLCAALKRVEFDSEDELEDFMVEIDILSNFKHENILSLHEVYIYDSKLWMYLELCGGGALDSIMETLEKGLTEPQIRFISKEVLQGLGFLHEKLIIHRDMKAGNILLTLNNEVKLADFGVSARLADEKQKRLTFIGTPYWMAPEVINCETFKDAPYNWKADIWSFGITLIELAQRRPPYNSINPTRVLLKISKSDPPTLSKPHLWSSKFKTFLARTLQKDPNQRPECKDLLLDPFVSDVTESDRKVIQILLCEVNADIIETVEDLDPNEHIDDIDDNELNTFILPVSTKFSIPVEVDDSGDDEVGERKDNLASDHEYGENIKELNDSNSGGDSGVSLGRTDSGDHYNGSEKQAVPSDLNGYLTEIADQVITDVITSDTQSPSITSCIFDVMRDSHSAVVESSNDAARVDDAATKKNRGDEVNINNGDRIREIIVSPRIKLTSSNVNENKSTSVNDTLMNASSSSSTTNHHNVNKPTVITSPLNRQNSAYRTRTRTRRFVVDGQVVTTTSKQIVNTNVEDRKLLEDEQIKRKAALRAFRILAKQEAHQTRELNERAQQQMEILESKMGAEFSTLTKTYDHKMEVVSRNYKLQMERLDKDFEIEMKVIRSETSKEERTFKDRLKSEIDTYDRAMRKAAKRDLHKYDHIQSNHGHMNPSLSSGSINSTISNNSNYCNDNSLVSQRLTMFREKQESRMNSRIYNLHEEYNKRRNLIHADYLNESHALRLNFEEDKWKIEHSYLNMKHQLDRNRQLDLFLIKREQLTGRSELELTELKQAINMERSKLNTIHSIEKKNFMKSLKAINKRSILTLQRQSRLNTIQANEAHKRMNEELELLESKHKTENDALEKSIHFRLQELEQSSVEKRNALIDQETKRLQELDNRHRNELRVFSESLARTKALLKEQFAHECKEDSFKINYDMYRPNSLKSRRHRIPMKSISSLSNLRWGSLSNSSTKLHHISESRPSGIITLFSSELNKNTN
ncbi:Serine/threonine-protein kinase 10 isoform 2 [Schistosoma japonicum]|uniref:Serine/threonine-protein kinase 10 isoform 2 n=2 Tax=Schistosoma japonicum TaxID=6182 RepID=A0A4Z2DNQ0_SCHJA|nr:Serine/threonine-protein kinase 10 isoform 2 [Schistosoma japonicum]